MSMAGLRVDGGLVRLERYQCIFGGNLITGTHQYFDNVDIGEIANVGNFNFYYFAHK